MLCGQRQAASPSCPHGRCSAPYLCARSAGVGGRGKKVSAEQGDWRVAGPDRHHHCPVRSGSSRPPHVLIQDLVQNGHIPFCQERVKVGLHKVDHLQGGRARQAAGERADSPGLACRQRCRKAPADDTRPAAYAHSCVIDGFVPQLTRITCCCCGAPITGLEAPPAPLPASAATRTARRCCCTGRAAAARCC